MIHAWVGQLYIFLHDFTKARSYEVVGHGRWAEYFHEEC